VKTSYNKKKKSTTTQTPNRSPRVGFVKLCSAALKSFDVECTWVTKADPDDFDGRKLPQVTLVGPYEGGVCWCPWSVLGYFLGEKKRYAT